MKLLPPLLAFAIAVPCLGCIFVRRSPPGGGPVYVGSSSGASSSGQSQPSSGTSPSGPATQPSQPPPEFIPSSLEMHSDCNRTLPIFLGEKPKFGSGTKSSIGSNTTTTFPRHPDGTMTVWIIDDSENGLASAFASKTTKRVAIGGDCKSIHAD